MRVGKYEIVHSVSYLQFAGQDAIVSFVVDDEEAKFRVRFIVQEEAEERASKQRMEGGPDPEDKEQGLITFVNWHVSSISSSGDEPVHVVTLGTKEKSVFLAAFAHYQDQIYSVTLQFMVENSQ